jgi:ornithine cyclodeaminase/alanine dehydrogenase
MSADKIIYLSRQDVEDVGLSMPAIIDALDSMFKEKGEGRVEMPPKPGIHTRKDAFIHAMPAYIPNVGAAGMKWVSGYPENHKRNLPYITGLIVLNDPDTGIPLAVMDATWITAQRTGAATAVAAKYLARKDCSTVGIIACGVQGRSNLEALASLFTITKVKAYDLYPEVAEKYAQEMAQKVQADIEVVAHPQKAVMGMDCVVTSGPIWKDASPVIEADWLSEGAFACLVDFDCYWKSEALEQMAYFRNEGYFPRAPQPYADLGQIVVGKKSGREKDDERTVCINLGLALDDMATAIQIYRKAIKEGIGTELAL